MTNHLEELKQAIIAKVPSIATREATCSECKGEGSLECICEGTWLEVAPITLCDVLRAIGKKGARFIYAGTGEFATHGRKAQYVSDGVFWDLSKDLDGQSDETKGFLYNLLCK